MNTCEICRKDSPEDGKLQKVYAKGYASLVKHCKVIGETSLLERLRTKWNSNSLVTVHQRCRSLFMLKERDIEEHSPRKKTSKVV